jgi:F-type H+-transporting ATPase subunit epsilon
MDAFTLDILVPSGKIVSTSVQAVTLPSEVGEIGVLPGHADYTASLSTGILEYTSADGKMTKNMVISGGIVQYKDGVLKVLTDSVDSPDKVKKGDYDKERITLETSMQGVDTRTVEWINAKLKLDRILAIDAMLAKTNKASLN